MMIFSHKNKKAHTGHELHEGFSNVGHDPFIDWLLILVLGLIVSVALIVVGFFSFVRVGSILSQPPANPTNTMASAIDPGLLNHVLRQFDARAREREDLLKGYKGPLDPSL